MQRVCWLCEAVSRAFTVQVHHLQRLWGDSTDFVVYNNAFVLRNCDNLIYGLLGCSHPPQLGAKSTVKLQNAKWQHRK